MASDHPPTKPNAQTVHSTHCRNHFNRHWLINSRIFPWYIILSYWWLFSRVGTSWAYFSITPIAQSIVQSPRTKMAKSARRRHHAERLRNKWLRLLGSLNNGINPNGITFGRTYNSDPIDCGNPRCKLCSSGKVLHSKEKRLLGKRAAKSELSEFDEGNG